MTPVAISLMAEIDSDPTVRAISLVLDQLLSDRISERN